MELKLITIFTVLSIINVIFSTIKSLVTINGNKYVASLISGVYYSYYNIVIIYTVADFSLQVKCIITFAANILGVFIVKWVEEKQRKDKLWIFHATAKTDSEVLHTIVSMLKDGNIKLVYNEIVPNELFSLTIYSYTQKESAMIKSVLNNYDVKYCAVETTNR